MATTREREIETAQYMAQYAAEAGAESIEAAMDQLRRMVEDLTREMARPENDLHKKLYHFR